MTMADNLMLKNYRKKPYSQGLFLSRPSMYAQAAALIRRFGVVPENPDLPAGSLSGGNLQRLILSRELSTAPLLLVAAYPFRGLDLKAVDFLGQTLREEAAGGLAVFLVGEDLELTLDLSDRIGVIYEGRILKVMSVSDVRLEELGLMMAGKMSKRGPR
jgi:simple sugar transport system ATP-binding protein